MPRSGPPLASQHHLHTHPTHRVRLYGTGSSIHLQQLWEEPRRRGDLQPLLPLQGRGLLLQNLPEGALEERTQADLPVLKRAGGARHGEKSEHAAEEPSKASSGKKKDRPKPSSSSSVVVVIVGNLSRRELQRRRPTSGPCIIMVTADRRTSSKRDIALKRQQLRGTEKR